jgi:hypothetical protein
MQVFLNPYDLYKIGRHLKLSHTKELFDRKLVEWASGQHNLTFPKIRFKRFPFPFCPFLINDFDETSGLRGLCSLHPDHKPLVCQLAPLTRELDLKKDSDTFGFIPPHPNCPGCGRGELLEEDQIREELKDELNWERLYYQNLFIASGKDPEKITTLFLFNLNSSWKGPTGS